MLSLINVRGLELTIFATECMSCALKYWIIFNCIIPSELATKGDSFSLVATGHPAEVVRPLQPDREMTYSLLHPTIGTK